MFPASGRTTSGSTRNISNNSVLVIGAGPAGSASALRLARAGTAVTLIDRAIFPRAKICGEYLSPASVAALHELGVAEQLRPHAHILQGVRVHARGRCIEFPFRSQAWALTRERLDAELLDAAVAAGARFVRARAEDAAGTADSVTVRARHPSGAHEVFSAGACVAADGAGSLIVRNLGVRVAPRTVVRFAMGGHFEGFSNLEPLVQMFVDGASYFAVNPLSPTRANVMLIASEADVGAHRGDIDAYLRARGAALAQGIDFTNARLSGRRLATGPLEHRAAVLRCGRILIAGDAARFLDPFTGQGVMLALFAARCASAALLSDRLSRYERELGRELARRDRLSALVRTALRYPVLARAPAALRPLLDAVSA